LLEPAAPDRETPPEAQASFRQLWQVAVEVGRKTEEAKTGEARAEADALGREAERLEGQVAELEDQLAEVRRSLNAALAEASTAHQEAKEARAAVALEQ